jgi:hypothetical protein
MFRKTCCDYLSTTLCRSAASGKIIFEIINYIPHIQYRYFRSSVQSNDGSYDVRDIDIPIQIVIGNTLQGVIMEIQSGLIKYEIW